MPSTFAGLLIFLVLLVPGFSFQLVHERGRFARGTPSIFRETAIIALSSLAFDLLTLATFGALQLAPWMPPDVDNLLLHGVDYARTAYVQLTVCAILMLGFATLIAVVTAGILNREGVQRRIADSKLHHLVVPSRGVTPASAWWKLLIEEHPDYLRLVRCFLEDGSSIQGNLKSLSPDIEETADRELVLGAPLVYVDKAGNVTRESFGAVTVSARAIRMLYVRYRGHSPIPSPPGRTDSQ